MTNTEKYRNQYNLIKYMREFRPDIIVLYVGNDSITVRRKYNIFSWVRSIFMPPKMSRIYQYTGVGKIRFLSGDFQDQKLVNAYNKFQS